MQIMSGGFPVFMGRKRKVFVLGSEGGTTEVAVRQLHPCVRSFSQLLLCARKLHLRSCGGTDVCTGSGEQV